MLLAEVSIWPMDQGQSVSPYVARVVRLIEASGLDHELGPLGTVIEGEVDEVFELIRQCHEELEADSDRIMCVIKTDFRRGRVGGIESKVRSVRDKLDRPDDAPETPAPPPPPGQPESWMRLVSDDDADQKS
ncbi:MAG: MTH1187 family thiamine-binding protein [Planctomycetota bacterium]